MISSLYNRVETALNENKQEADDFLKRKIREIETDLDSGRIDAETAISKLRDLLSYKLKEYNYKEIKNSIS